MRINNVKRTEDVISLQPFDMKVLQIRSSLAQDAELKTCRGTEQKDTAKVYFFCCLKLYK